MTKRETAFPDERDQMAMEFALELFLALKDSPSRISAATIAAMAYELVDAMIEARDKQ